MKFLSLFGLILITYDCFEIYCAENTTDSANNTLNSVLNLTPVHNSIGLDNPLNNRSVQGLSPKREGNTSASALSPKRKYQVNRVRKVNIEIIETNMYTQEVDRCKTVVNETLSHEYGSRKTARVLKSELDEIFKDQKYRFSVVITSDLSDMISKSLYGVWISIRANNKHYLLMASYKALTAKKLSEAQMDRIEDWTSVYYISYENMTKHSRLEKVAKMLKDKLDINYGKGNAWAVIAFKHSTALRAKRLFEGTPQIQFKRLDGTVWMAFRGGEEVPLNNRLNESQGL